MPTHQKPPDGFAFIEDYVDENDTVIVPGIASRLGITPGTYRKWRMAGKGPATTIHGKKVIASVEAVDAYFAGLCESASVPNRETRPPEPRLTRRPRKKAATRPPAPATAAA